MDKQKSSHGQASLEFIIVLGIVLTIFMVLGYVVYKNYVRSNDLKAYMAGVRLANHFADNVNALNSVGDGYSTYMKLPATLYGQETYTISFFDDESSVFIIGSGFAGGSQLTYSAPLSSSKVACLLPECHRKCNESEREQCMQVEGETTVRMTRYGGTTYLSRGENVVQDDFGYWVRAFEAVKSGEVQDYLERPDGEAGQRWNTLYVLSDKGTGESSLVFSMNLSAGETMIVDVDEIIGEIKGVKSAGDGEFDLDVEPEGEWSSDGSALHGAVIEFGGGFRVCLDPQHMPGPSWIFLDGSGDDVELDKYGEVCIAYP